MKTNKILIMLLLVTGSFALSGCSDWLNVKPIDQMLNDEMFSTEMNTNSVLTGIYRGMAARNLYGEAMTQTFTEHLAHFYWYGPVNGSSQDVAAWAQVAHFNYSNEDVQKRTQNIWDDTYALILRLNAFIYNVEAQDNRIVNESRRNILLGEAYALRAFLHFDILRLFGPIDMSDAIHPGLPYNRNHEVVPHPNQTAANFINLVLADLATAGGLLKNDPILNSGINDNPVGGNLIPEDIFARYYRNRRMNVYAVNALEARVLLHAGKHNEAAAVARALIDTLNEKNTFAWVPARTENERATIMNERNFIFYNEVMFALDNISLHATWRELFDGTRIGATHVVTFPQLNRVFGGFEGALSEVRDIRVRQWVPSNISPLSGNTLSVFPVNTHISSRFKQGELARFKDFQPLMRISELHYILVEAAIANNQPKEAAETLNHILNIRGLIDLQLLDPATATIETVIAHLDNEMYKEFVGEGQIFFYLKRNSKERILNGEGVLMTLDSPRAVYVLPLPKSEIMI